MRKPRTALMTVVAVAATASLSLGGVALAATGLPGSADDHAAEQVAELTIPGPAEASDGHADQRGRSVVPTSDETQAPVADDDSFEAADPATSDTESGDEAQTPEPRPTDTHGYDVSQLATTTAATGRDKGAEISAEARTNRPAGDETEVADEDEETVDATSSDTPQRSETGEAARSEHAKADAR
ncbi:MAG TPA: hypothetical protein VLC50_02325 [Actinomycetes bacterium]|nr:hypothetical protein [Actinomycetes bacterium]